MSWTWQGRQLTTAEKGGTTLSYTYDSEGIRTSKTVGSTTTKYLLNGTQILAQTTNGKTLCSFYDQQGNRVGRVGKALGQDIFTPESFEEMHKAGLVILRCVNGKFAAVKAYRIAARDGIVRRNEPCPAERFHALRSVIKA